LKFFLDTANLDGLRSAVSWGGVELDQFLKDWATVFEEMPAAV